MSDNESANHPSLKETHLKIVDGGKQSQSLGTLTVQFPGGREAVYENTESPFWTDRAEGLVIAMAQDGTEICVTYPNVEMYVWAPNAEEAP